VDALKPSSSDRQIVLLQALGKRADASALPAVSAAAKSGPTPVRLAAIDSLASIGSNAAIPALTDLMGAEDREIAQAAQESFASLPGKEVDAAVVAMLNSGDVNRKIAALDLVSRRRMMSSMPVVLNATRDPDARVRAAATRKLGEMGSASDVPPLLEMLMTAKTGQDIEAAEQALTTVLGRAQNPESSVGTLTGRMPQASAEQKSALLRILSTVGGSSALQAVRAAVDDPNADVRTTAVRALGAWKSAEAAPDLLALAKSSPNNTTKVLALRGYLRLATLQEIAVQDRLDMCRQAASVVQRPEEKRLLLTALGAVRSRESLALAVPFLADEAVKEEASAAIVSIAENLLRGRNVAPAAAAAMQEPLNQVAATTGNADLAKRAKELAGQAKTRAGAK
jgi:HEAT repeat protein